jgi:hypothetical protein
MGSSDATDAYDRRVGDNHDNPFSDQPFSTAYVPSSGGGHRLDLTRLNDVELQSYLDYWTDRYVKSKPDTSWTTFWSSKFIGEGRTEKERRRSLPTSEP